MAKQRIEYIDLAKGFCILLVVWVHLSAFYSHPIPCADFFKAFRMPLYFFLSGCFFKAYNGFLDFTIRKINKLLIPFIFFYILTSFIISNIQVHLLGCECDFLSFSRLFTAPWEETFPNEPLWFLLCLFEDSLLFYGIYNLGNCFEKHSTILIVLISILLGIIGLLLAINNINIPLFLDSALSAIPFFALGYIVFRKTQILKPQAWDKYLPIIIIISFALILPLGVDYSFRLNKFTTRAALTVYPCGILGVFGIVMLAKTIKQLPLVSYLGRYSIMILVTHVDVYNVYAAILKYSGIPFDIAFYINLLATILSYLAIIPLMKKFMPYVTAQKDIIPTKSK